MTIRWSAVAAVMIRSCEAFESVLRRLQPLALPELREELMLQLEPLAEARRLLRQDDPVTGLDGTHAVLGRACDFLIQAIRNFADEEDLQAAYISALRAARKFCRAQETIFDLCGTIDGVNRYFLENGSHSGLREVGKAGNAETGVYHNEANRDLHARGGYSLFVPESYTSGRSWPLVVALHGGYSHGRDFLWTWLREARSRGFILVAPTSQAMTWSIARVESDEELLNHHLDEVCSRVHVDRSRIFLTGMSDGGTFALALGLSGKSIYQAVAPLCCALPPVDERQVKGKRILWVHGAQDWIFPVSWTIQACRHLRQFGAEMTLKVMEDLSHTYPREANDVILRWFGIADIH